MSANRNEKEKNIDHFVGPSLFNNKWSNNKWDKRVNYYPTELVTSSAGHHNPKNGTWTTNESDLDSNSSSSNSRSSSRDGSRHSSISDQQLDPRSLIGVGLMIANDRPNPTSVSNPHFLSFSSPNDCNMRKRQRKRRPLVYCDAYNWPMCNHQYCYYYGSLCQYPLYNTCMPPKFNPENENAGRKTSSTPFNYYYMMDPSFATRINSTLASAYSSAKLTPPPERGWIPVEDVNDHCKLASVTTMSYNILCDKYVSSNLHAIHPSWSLNWEYRKRLIFQQLQKYEPDIIALQELETVQYWTYFKPKLESLGYASSFSARSRAKTMSYEERQSVDGCALFWKADKFELYKEHVIEFTQLAIAKAERSQHMLNRVMTRDNIALTAVLRFRASEGVGNGDSLDNSAAGIPLVVCSTHIHWDPEFCDVKLIQTMMLAQELSSIVDRTAQEFDFDMDEVPLLLCGDLNSTEDSSVFDFLTLGSVEADHEDFKDFRGQTCLQKLSSSNDPDIYSHDLLLNSAYDVGMLPFTNYAFDFKGVIDYIFASPSLICEAVLGPVDVEWFRENALVACPCPHIPSDHLPLLTKHSIVLPLDSDEIGMNTQAYDRG